MSLSTFRPAVLLGFAALLVMTLVAPLSAQSVSLTGAGSTFVYPALSRWVESYHAQHANVSVNYQPIGSGGGIQQVRNATVDFGATDMALNDTQLHMMPALVQLPVATGPVCVTYNLPELKQPLKLTGGVLSQIFLGRITHWDDAALRALNPGVALPHLPVLVAHRADGSGTTFIFTSYLSAVSPEWAQKVSHNTSVNWPVGMGGKGNQGVTALVRQSHGTIGYVEYAYAVENHLPVAALKNKAGHFILPSPAGVSAAMAADAAQLRRDVRLPIVDAPGARSYPIAGFTFLLVPTHNWNASKLNVFKDFFKYAVTTGQDQAAQLNYAKLPGSIVSLDLSLLNQVR